ncbi:tetratricopeptide repeat protein [Streptomyces sp. ME02-8801-2C]|uniref:ATP-binding protein n=1 Tax=Streptomyces sp. ME02-8801-2C TaxID=3028680 RepID=UPI0029A5FE8B|nr:tetratricopeptide repeat protein [Streptomyces sp. ME02-8801-2C]MDX3455724.1 tetratricopeptide repeat protein [Streptomyces sp. ME02-8801-2C]
MLGEVLRDRRRRLGLTQEELAERAGVSVRTICHVETGRIEHPRPATVRRLADALDLTGTDLEDFQRAATGVASPTPHPSRSSNSPYSPYSSYASNPSYFAYPEAKSIPAQLPPAHPGFSGRATQLAALDALLDGGADESQAHAAEAVVVSAIAGTAGVGKTALAVHWASRVAARFPDGQLYVNLRGFHPTGAVMTSAEAVRVFLDAFEVPAERVPAGAEAQFGLYRSLCAGKRLLVLLDNARDAEQVRPLLPGAPGCLALVTSRNQLTGLVAADGAHPLRVDLLTTAEARQLLAGRLGPARLAEDPKAVTEIINRCAGLPLALSIVAARAATDPHFRLAEFAGELRATGTGALDPFTDDDPATDVRAVFSWSYHHLGPEAARLFRLLGPHPGPDITAPAAAGLTGLGPERLRPHLAELTRAHLLNQHAPGRYTLHDLLRAYATELTHEHDPEPDRRAALRRLLDHYLHTAATASEALSWYRDPIALPDPDDTVVRVQLDSPAQALAWFTAELPNLTAAVQQAARSGFETHAWQLAWTMAAFFDLAGYWPEWVTTHQQALDATRRAGDTVGEARTRRNLARVRSRQGRHQDALVHLGRALSLSRELGDPVGQAQALRNMSAVLGRRARHTDALDLARQALILFQGAGHRIGQGRVLNQIGWHLSMLGDHRQTVDYCRRSLRILQELGDRDGEGATWNSLGRAHHHLGAHQEAITCFNRSLNLRRERGDLGEIAETLDHLADAHLSVGDHATAATCWREALELLDRLGHKDTEAVRIRARLRGLETPNASPAPTPPDDTLHLA